MQYILTEDEHKTLMQEVQSWRELRFTIKELQDFCTRVADTMPIAVPWSKEKAPWGCIRTTTEYCDECPAKRICPHKGKRYSQ